MLEGTLHVLELALFVPRGAVFRVCRFPGGGEPVVDGGLFPIVAFALRSSRCVRWLIAGLICLWASASENHYILEGSARLAITLSAALMNPEIMSSTVRTLCGAK